MKIYELEWQTIPTTPRSWRVARIEAETENDAKELLRDSVRATGTAQMVVVRSCKEYAPPTVKGKVLAMG